MDRIQAMSAFLAVVDTGGFSSAARKLDISPSVVTRAVSDLEERLSTRLLTRTTRFVRVTDAGADYAEKCRRILSAIEDADASLVGSHAVPRGELTVTASVNFGRMHVAPIIRDYLSQFPEVDVNCWYMDRVVNLVDEGVDVAVRIGNLPDSSLQATRVGRVRHVICGAPAYLARMGIPHHPSDLQNHVTVATSGIPSGAEWRFREAERTIVTRLRPRMTTTTNESAADTVLAGFGLTRLPYYHVAQAVANNDLSVVLEDFELVAVPIHVVHREGRHASRKVRLFIDMAVAALQANPLIQ